MTVNMARQRSFPGLLKRLLGMALVALILLSAGMIFRGLGGNNSDPQLEIAQEWQKTGINMSDLLHFLNRQNCSENAESSVACVYSLMVLLENKPHFIGQQQPNSASPWEILNVEQISSARFLKKLENGSQKTILLNLFETLNVHIGSSQPWQGLDSLLSSFQSFLKNQNMSFTAQEIGKAINAYLSAAIDPHTYIMPYSLFEKHIGRSEDSVVGVGIKIKRDLTGKVFIAKVLPGSDGLNKGLVRGDELLAINGLPVADKSLESIKASLEGSLGSEVFLTIKKNQNIKNPNRLLAERTVSVRRENLNTKAVHLELVSRQNETLALIRILKFSHGSCAQFEESLTEALARGAKGLILDLRDNGGGQLDQAHCMSSMVLPKGTKVFETHNILEDATEVYVTNKKPIYFGPIVTLINRGTASAAEILAGVLQEKGRAFVMGEPSFGKGSYQNVRIWSRNSKVLFMTTQGLYYFASGKSPQLQGVIPDQIISGSTQLQEGREVDLYYNPLVLTETEKGKKGIYQGGNTNLNTFKPDDMDSNSQILAALSLIENLEQDLRISFVKKKLLYCRFSALFSKELVGADSPLEQARPENWQRRDSLTTDELAAQDPELAQALESISCLSFVNAKEKSDVANSQ